MTFEDALEAMRCGKKIKRPSWGGYWVMADDKRGEDWKRTVHMYCKDGRVVDIRDSEDVFFTLSNIVANDWEVTE